MKISHRLGKIRQCEYQLSEPRANKPARQCKNNGRWQWKYDFMTTSVMLCKTHYDMEFDRHFRVLYSHHQQRSE